MFYLYVAADVLSVYYVLAAHAKDCPISFCPFFTAMSANLPNIETNPTKKNRDSPSTLINPRFPPPTNNKYPSLGIEIKR